MMTDKKNNDSDILVKNIKALKSDNPLILKDTLVNIREKGNAAYLPVLIELLLKHKGNENGDLIRAFIADIKDSSIKSAIVDSLQDEKYECIKKELLSVCWESAVDFSSHVSTFTSIVITNEFNAAFEALTVIEHLEGEIENEHVSEQIDKLMSAISSADESRKYLLHETIKILQDRIA